MAEETTKMWGHFWYSDGLNERCDELNLLGIIPYITTYQGQRIQPRPVKARFAEIDGEVVQYSAMRSVKKPTLLRRLFRGRYPARDQDARYLGFGTFHHLEYYS